uniref:GDNF family receptor alpha-4-like n=1 Tax=Sinocyclocheilus grahami TaxID=75366 RepID=A0A672MUC7_SINGR
MNFTHNPPGAVPSVVPVFPGTVDCIEAVQECIKDPECKRQLRHLEYCVDEEAVAPLSLEGRQACVDAQNNLMHYQSLQECKCQRGSRMEQQCLSIYWTVRFPQGYDDIETSPYEDIELELVKNSETSKLASIVSVSSLPLTDQNQCLKAAQDCGLYEKCGSLRSEYALACTKIIPGTNHCNRHKCHRALRRFLERVPEEYSFGVLFCPCSDTLCGERRRKTIVPSCSYEERDGQPNCLNLESYCLKDNLCRSRLADFQQNCQPSSLSPSGCLRESVAVCLKAYAGLIGTIMTPNYVSNSSTEVSQWCNCEGSGNQWQDCLRILHMFNSNTCLREDNLGLQTKRIQFKTFLCFQKVVESEEDEEEEEEEEEEDQTGGGGGFNVIPPFSDKATVTNLGSEAGRVHSSASTFSIPHFLLAALLLIALRWG